MTNACLITRPSGLNSCLFMQEQEQWLWKAWALNPAKAVLESSRKELERIWYDQGPKCMELRESSSLTVTISPPFPKCTFCTVAVDKILQHKAGTFWWSLFPDKQYGVWVPSVWTSSTCALTYPLATCEWAFSLGMTGVLRFPLAWGQYSPFKLWSFFPLP